MSNKSYIAQEMGPAEVDAFLRARAQGRMPSHLGSPIPSAHRKMVLASGFEVKGEFELTARDVRSGEVEWQTKQENLLTDIARSAWFDNGLQNLRLGFAPSQEAPSIFRSAVPTDGNQTFLSGNLSPTITPSTYTKQYSTTFGTPASNRTLGIIWTSYYTGSSNDVNFGAIYIWSYSLLTPPKTQTTTQTLEVVYKLSMNPVY